MLAIAGIAIALLPQGQMAVLAGVCHRIGRRAAIFAEPALGIVLVMLAGPFQPLERVALQLPIDSGQVILGITLLAYLFRALLTRQSPISILRSPITLALAAFIAVCLLSFLPAREFSSWANECIKWLQIAVIALLVVNEPR